MRKSTIHAARPPTQVYPRPLIPVLLALMCGITAGVYLPNLPWMFLVLAVAFLFSVLLVWKARQVGLVPLVLFFLLGYWGVQGWMGSRQPPNHVSRFIDGKPWHIIGTLNGQPRLLSDRTRFTLKVESLTRKQTCHSVAGSLRVTVRGDVSNLCSGERIGCLAKLKEIRNFNNWGGFNYRRYLAFRGVWASAFVSREDWLVRMHTVKANWFLRALDRARKHVSGLIERASTQDTRGILKALLIGDRSEISPESRHVFNRIGIGHLLAISGLHIGMVATLSFLLFRYLLSRSQRILLAGWVTRGTALMCAVPVLFYGLLAGMSPATQRAVIMVLVFLIAVFVKREHDTINTLAVAALVILIMSPTAFFQVSFQLSFVAAFAILYMLRNFPLTLRLKGGPSTATKRGGLFLLVSGAAILGTLPLTLHYFNQASIIGLFTNCIMVPLVGFMVVPLGLLAVLFSPITSTVALWIMKVAALLMQGGVALAIVFSKCPFAAVKTVTPTVIEIALYYALAWALFNYRNTRLAKITLLGVMLIASVDVAYWAKRRYGNRELTITFIDVGQGNAALLELPMGACMLVDGGGFYGNRFDIGARIVAPFLWRKKIATVETLVLSHPDPDHLNGLLFIANHFNVQEVWMNREGSTSEPYRDFLRVISKKHIRVRGLEDLAKPRRINGVRFESLYPPCDFLKRKQHDAWRTPNNNSLVLKATLGEVSFLFPGDIEVEAEDELMAAVNSTLKSDVLLVPHHGSKTSSSPRFVKCVDPTIAVISAGWKNIFGLPSPKVVRHYETCGCRIFRTDQDGAITVTTDGTNLDVKTFLSDRTELGLVRVRPKSLGDDALVS